MKIFVIDLKELGLPEDVIKNSGAFIPLIGNPNGDDDEIIVISQLGRYVYNAYVCHLSNGYDPRNGTIPCKMICDMPNFPKIIVSQSCTVKTINGIKHTMMCLADIELDVARSNWLY